MRRRSDPSPRDLVFETLVDASVRRSTFHKSSVVEIRDVIDALSNIEDKRVANAIIGNTATAFAENVKVDLSRSGASVVREILLKDGKHISQPALTALSIAHARIYSNKQSTPPVRIACGPSTKSSDLVFIKGMLESLV
jgi:hypothetical protein